VRHCNTPFNVAGEPFSPKFVHFLMILKTAQIVYHSNLKNANIFVKKFDFFEQIALVKRE